MRAFLQLKFYGRNDVDRNRAEDSRLGMVVKYVPAWMAYAEVWSEGVEYTNLDFIASRFDRLGDIEAIGMPETRAAGHSVNDYISSSTYSAPVEDT